VYQEEQERSLWSGTCNTWFNMSGFDLC